MNMNISVLSKEDFSIGMSSGYNNRNSKCKMYLSKFTVEIIVYAKTTANQINYSMSFYLKYFQNLERCKTISFILLYKMLLLFKSQARRFVLAECRRRVDLQKNQ